MTVIAHTERTFILTQAEEGKSPEYIAAALVQRRALEEVLGVLADHATTLALSAHIRSSDYYQFISPPDAEGVRQSIKVLLSDFDKFCEVHGLKEKDMRRVADGELGEHRGWTQGPVSPLGNCRMTSRTNAYRHQRVEEVMRGITKTEPAKLPPLPRTDTPAMLPTTTFRPD